MISAAKLGISTVDYYSRHFPGLKKSSGKVMVRCSFHRESTGSLLIDLETGRFHCYGCGEFGDLLDFHQKIYGLDFKAAISDLGSGAYSLQKAEPILPQPRQRNEEKIAKARELWYHGVPIQAGDLVELYLRGRGIELDRMPESLRFHPHLHYWTQNDDGKWVSLGAYPAMLSRIDTPSGALIAVQRTYLTNAGRKADVENVRKITGLASGGVVRLCEPVNSLAVAEGTETALSYHQLTGVPVWSCVSTSGLGKVELPTEVEEFIICVDLDPNGTGERAAEKLATRILEQKKRVLMARPPVSANGLKKDWNDYLRELKKR